MNWHSGGTLASGTTESLRHMDNVTALTVTVSVLTFLRTSVLELLRAMFQMPMRCLSPTVISNAGEITGENLHSVGAQLPGLMTAPSVASGRLFCATGVPLGAGVVTGVFSLGPRCISTRMSAVTTAASIVTRNFLLSISSTFVHGCVHLVDRHRTTAGGILGENPPQVRCLSEMKRGVRTQMNQERVRLENHAALRLG